MLNSPVSVRIVEYDLRSAGIHAACANHVEIAKLSQAASKGPIRAMVSVKSDWQ
jgi:hypothetical protein